MSIFLTRLKKNCRTDGDPAIVDPFLRYVEQGDESALERVASLVRQHGTHWMYDVWEYLPPPDKLVEEEKRVMRAATRVDRAFQVARWLRDGVKRNRGSEQAFLNAYIEACGNDPAGRIRAAEGLLKDGPEIGRTPENGPSAVETFLLSLDRPELSKLAGEPDEYHGLLKLLLQRAPERVPAIFEKYLFCPFQDSRRLNALACGLLLEYDPTRYEDAVGRAFREDSFAGSRFEVGVHLTNLNPEKYRQETGEFARACLEKNLWVYGVEGICKWLAEHYGTDTLDEMGSFLSRVHSREWFKETLRDVLTILGREARPAVIIAARENPFPEPRLLALEQLTRWGDESDRESIRQGFEQGFREEDRYDVIPYVRSAARDLENLEDLVWKLAKHKSQPVRDTAARTLGRLGDSAVPEAGKLLVAKSAATRSFAVMLLRAVRTPAAVELLESRLNEEPNDDVRDRILLALERAWEAEGREITREDIDQRIERTEARLESPVADWLDESQLPPLVYTDDGQPLSHQAVRYLLYRQSRAKEMRVDVEAKPLFARIDRRTSGDFALAVLESFLHSEMEAKDRWAMVLAARLGDDRIVSPLVRQVREWGAGQRGKMGEYAAHSLALLGTDVALSALDGLTIRFRSRQRNIGKAASEALVDAAERLGVTIDELGDRIVPWLGFQAGESRVIEQGGRRIEVAIGLDFKLTYRDLDKAKKIKSLPASIPAEVKKENKKLAAMLREVIKGQLVRVENLMVRQFRWPVPRWRELYLTHPLLFPFAVRLIWGVYGADGRLQAAFRVLEDRSLTDVTDEAFEIPDSDGVTVGMIHPLELTPDERDAWLNHLADYNIEPPLEQLERPVVFPGDEEKNARLSTKYCGREINVMSFRSRAERHGWQRGLVGESATIWCYHKSFPGAGADAILELEDFYLGLDMDSEITLGKFCFVRTGIVLHDDERAEFVAEDDEKLIPFGEVPPVVYSETVSDLERIAAPEEEWE